MSCVKALVITGYGINCEKEMAVACEMAGADTTICHAQRLLNHQVNLNDYHFLCLPGGFAFGDELGAAKVLANRISRRESLIQDLKDFVAEGKCILGVCNGFQLLVKLGLLPNSDKEQRISLTYNDHARFDNRWIGHRVHSSHCIFTQGLDHLHLPIRHGEGKFVVKDKKFVDELISADQVVFRYHPNNPNGSEEHIAGICDSTGRILGMMAHPEAALYFTNHPDWLRRKEQSKREKTPLPEYGEGYMLFKNAIDYLNSS
ncbi:MAG: Phosphoribosylformylglycinamidine synthase subunit PurQ [Chlamydiae bacterium]|nr:Phosphoribosylformylglycinamidine synthase subunit PurQ [Chlamydiota bacterium]